MTLLPSQYHPGEFYVENGDARDIALAQAVGGAMFNRQLHLTPARARKFNLLRSWGFSAVRSGAGWRFRRGTSAELALYRAMQFIEVMSAAPMAPAAQ